MEVAAQSNLHIPILPSRMTTLTTNSSILLLTNFVDTWLPKFQACQLRTCTKDVIIPWEFNHLVALTVGHMLEHYNLIKFKLRTI